MPRGLTGKPTKNAVGCLITFYFITRFRSMWNYSFGFFMMTLNVTTVLYGGKKIPRGLMLAKHVFNLKLSWRCKQFGRDGPNAYCLNYRPVWAYYANMSTWHSIILFALSSRIPHLTIYAVTHSFISTRKTCSPSFVVKARENEPLSDTAGRIVDDRELLLALYIRYI